MFSEICLFKEVICVCDYMTGSEVGIIEAGQYANDISTRSF